MSFFRKDPFGRAWVLLSPERGLEASDFGSVPPPQATSPLSPRAAAGSGEDPNRGDPLMRNLHEVAAVRPATSPPNSPDWRIRSLEHPARIVGARPVARGSTGGLFRQVEAYGVHELIVEHPSALERLETMSEQHLTEVLRFYRERLEFAAAKPGIEHVQITRSFGRAAGALFDHPHGQLLAVPVTDRWLLEELEVAGDHHTTFGSCLYCDVLDAELTARERLVTENDAFVAFCPYAAKTPFETWILPKQHQSSFVGVSSNLLPLFAEILQVVVRGLADALDTPPYNLALHSGVKSGQASFHWHVEILPRLTEQAGFDWGTGFFLNPTLPEDAARFLRQAVALQEVMR